MTPDEIDIARREFLDQCEMVVRVPWVWRFEGSPHNLGGTVLGLPLPIYTYVGVSKAEQLELHVSWCTPRGDLKSASHFPFFSSLVRHGVVRPPVAPAPPPRFISYLEYAFDRRWALKAEFSNAARLIGDLGDAGRFFNEQDAYRVKDNFNERRIHVWFDTLPYPDTEYGHHMALETFDCGLDLAAAIIAYLDTMQLTPPAGNTLLRIYAESINKGDFETLFKSRVTLDDPQPISADDGQQNGARDALRQIFAWTCAGYTDAFAFLPALLGNQMRDEPRTVRVSSNRLHELLWQPFDRKDLKAIIEGTHASIFFRPDAAFSGSDILIAWWEGKEQGLFGPVLAPLFLGESVRFPDSFHIDISQDNPHRKVQYCRPYLSLIGPPHWIAMSRREIEQSNLGWILYDSRKDGWAVEAARFLREKEYRMPSPPLPEAGVIATVAPSSPAVSVDKATKSRPVKKEFIVWSLSSTPTGIQKTRKEEGAILSGKKKIQLLLVKEKTATRVFVLGRSTAPPPGEYAYRILSYHLKNKGMGGTAWNIAQYVYAGRRDVEDAKRTANKREISRISRGISRRIVDLNRYCEKRLKLRLKADDTFHEYTLEPIPDYCLIEEIVD